MSFKKVIFLFSIFVFFLAGCSDSKPPIRIGVNDWPPCEVWYIAEHNGFFEDVPVQIVRYSTWSDNMRSLYIGNIDITHSTFFNAIFFHGKGEDAKIILASDTVVGGDGLAVQKHIESVEDLKDKTIAVEINTDEHFLLYKTLQKDGVWIQDTKIVNAAASEGKALFLQGKVDAVYTYEPYLSQAAEGAEGRVLATTRDLKGFMVDALVAREEVIDSRKKELQTILRAWFKALDYIKRNPEKSYALMAENENVSAESFQNFFEYFKFYNVTENNELYSSPELASVFGEMSEFIGSSVKSVADVYTDEIINE